MNSTTTRAGFIPADTLAALSAILATLPDEYPNSIDALPNADDVRGYFDTLRVPGPFTLRRSDRLTVAVTSVSLELDQDVTYWAAKGNTAGASVVIGLDVSRNGQTCSAAWVRRAWDRRDGQTVARYDGRPWFGNHHAPTFYDAARGRFVPLPVAALELVRGFAVSVFDGLPVTGDDVIGAAWIAAGQRDIRESARAMSRALEIATLSAGHVR